MRKIALLRSMINALRRNIFVRVYVIWSKIIWFLWCYKIVYCIYCRKSDSFSFILFLYLYMKKTFRAEMLRRQIFIEKCIDEKSNKSGLFIQWKLAFLCFDKTFFIIAGTLRLVFSLYLFPSWCSFLYFSEETNK